MIVGNTTLDPRRVVYTEIARCEKDWKLSIAYLVGETMVTLEQFGTKDEMNDLANTLDSMAYKGDPASAVGGGTVEGVNDGIDADDMDMTDDNRRAIWERIRDSLKRKVGFRP